MEQISEGKPVGGALPYLWPTVATFFWAGNFVAGRIAVQDIGPLSVGALRVAIASPILFLLLWWQEGKPHWPDRREAILYVSLGALGVAAFNLLYYSGMKYTMASEASLIMAVAPVTTAVLAAIFIGEKLTIWKLIGAIVSFAGVGLVVGADLGVAGYNPARLLGDALILAATLAWTGQMIISRVAMTRASPLAVAAYSGVIGMLFLVPFGVWETATGSNQTFSSMPSWGAILYGAIFANVLASVFWNVGIRDVGASRAAVLSNLMPVIALLLSVVLLSEVLLPMHLAGAALVLMGVWFTMRR
ncbi:MAG: DMT family transporter [Chloroflexi bacterium]|nr:DMT family transporter [Chloroflexota bacterium]